MKPFSALRLCVLAPWRLFVSASPREIAAARRIEELKNRVCSQRRIVRRLTGQLHHALAEPLALRIKLDELSTLLLATEARLERATEQLSDLAKFDEVSRLRPITGPIVALAGVRQLEVNAVTGGGGGIVISMAGNRFGVQMAFERLFGVGAGVQREAAETPGRKEAEERNP